MPGPVNAVQVLSQDLMTLDVANVTSGRFPKGCAVSRGKGIVNNESSLYLNVVFKKLRTHLSFISNFSLTSPKHHLNSPFSKAHSRYSAASKL